MKQIHCDVLILGGGPAGTLAATRLSKSGMDVIQVVKGPGNQVRPYEVLAPATRQLLFANGLSEPVQGTSDCRGVLSMWEGATPHFYDYRFMTAQTGLTIDRDSFHQSLAITAKEAGVRVISMDNDRPLLPDIENDKCSVITVGQCTEITFRFVIDARGRQSNPIGAGHIKREYHSELIALSTPFVLQEQWHDCLIVEAAEHGWWYIPPTVGKHSQLVFLTDMDILPKTADNKKEWLRNSYRQSLLLPSLTDQLPAFDQIKGTDARFSRLSCPRHHNCMAVGDSAIALDPLSGTGTWTALSSAEMAVSVILNNGEAEVYNSWCQQVFEHEQQMYFQTYASAAHRFREAIFWKRRLDGKH